MDHDYQLGGLRRIQCGIEIVFSLNINWRGWRIPELTLLGESSDLPSRFGFATGICWVNLFTSRTIICLQSGFKMVEIVGIVLAIN